jgi:glycosyltransferase involved in cell wall biosynthesis
MRSVQDLSVVMPVHNALPYLDEAIASVLGQTKKDFNFVIYDDASTDGSAASLQSWAERDSRIELHSGDRNLGPAASSNEVVRFASSRFIARMDADDVSTPDRLERELNILMQNPDVGLVGSLCEVIDSEGRLLREPDLWRLRRKSWSKPFPHGSIMFRRELFDEIGGYRDECEFWEDLDFVVRASHQTRILVLPRPLYRYRQSSSCTRLASNQRRVEDAIDLRYRAVGLLSENRDRGQSIETERTAAESRNSGTETQKVDPRVFVSLGSLALLSGQPPRIGSRFLARARLGLDHSTIVSAVWVAWASLSPSSLRGVMNLLSKVRNAFVRGRIDPEIPVEWPPPEQSSR